MAPPGRDLLGRKQRTSHEDFVLAMCRIEDTVTRAELDALVDQTAHEIHKRCAGKRAAYGWSGGKDSIALQLVAELAGVRECVLVMSELEYPAFLRWTTDNMPDRLEVISTGQDLAWLSRHPEMLFPRDADTAGRWFAGIQHAGQEKYFKARELDVFLVGRRRADGNFVGPDGEYSAKGVTRYSPIRDWRHEDVLAAVHYHNLPMPPCYGWPRGYRVGTGPWPARQWCDNESHGWDEVFAIDSSIVYGAAAAGFAPARAWLKARSL